MRKKKTTKILSKRRLRKRKSKKALNGLFLLGKEIPDVRIIDC
jgi:hypothetical protein